MKKLILVIMSIVMVFTLSLAAIAAETLHYAFEGKDALTTVTNTLKTGGSVKYEEGYEGNALVLDGTYGLKLGNVNNTFTVSALVKISSTGGTNTIFFKDMDNIGNKWTGILSNGQKPSFWTHNNNTLKWKTVASGENDLSQWCYVTYVENNGNGSLYIDGELIGSGEVATGSGTLYLGVTYWNADAVTGLVDEVKLYNTALTASEVMSAYEEYVDFENAIKLPGEVISDIELPRKIASKTVSWKTSDENAIDINGNVTRGDVDKEVTLQAFINGEVIGEYKVTVLKKPVVVNEKILLNYVFDENDGEIIHDKSGNGNHGASYGNLAITKNGACFDGVDDYVIMPEGVIYGYDDITIVMTMKPESAQKHVFAYGFGNTSETGYICLNPSRPDTNTLRFAATKASYNTEKDIKTLPGIRSGEWATVTVVLNGEYCSMYVDGDLVMDGNIGMEVSDLGKTTSNYIAKSLYSADPYFKGEVKEFTVYGYSMSDTKVKELYKAPVEYLVPEETREYITSVSFENGIDVTVDTFGRDDVKVGAVVLNENNEIVEFNVVSPDEEITLTKTGTVCVFAFNEEDNIPGSLYVKGEGEGFEFKYTPGKITIVSDASYNNGMVIIAGYDIAGTLTGVCFKSGSIEKGTEVEIEGNFDNAVVFKMLYWENLVSMIPGK